MRRHRRWLIVLATTALMGVGGCAATDAATSATTAAAPPTSAGSAAATRTTPPGITTASTAPSPTTTTVSAPATATTAPPPDRWIPDRISPWQWLLAHPLDVDRAADMGTGARDQLGTPVPDPTVYDIDGFTNPAATVAELHARGAHVICYIETGAWESYRPDAAQFPSEVLGRPMDGYPEERYLDIRSPVVAELIRARVQMCADKGFDAVEPDIDDSYAEDTGFPITRADNLGFNTMIAQYAHGLGLSIGLKNGDEPEFAAAMEPVVDFALVEQCFEYDTCASFRPFTDAGKAIFAVEYDLDRDDFCPAANALGFNATRHEVELDGGRQPCP